MEQCEESEDKEIINLCEILDAESSGMAPLYQRHIKIFEMRGMY